MKKLFTILILSFVAICSYGQISVAYDTTFFRCNKVSEHIKYYNYFYRKYSNDIVKFATVLKNVFPKDQDDLLHVTYILKTTDEYDIELIKKVCKDWCGMAFSYDQLTFIEQINDCIKGKGQYSMVGLINIPHFGRDENYKLHALLDINICFKENRIRIEIICNRYQGVSESSLGTHNIDIIIPGKTEPFNEEYNVYRKIAYAESYTNFCKNTILSACSLIDFLNKNIHPTGIQEVDDW